MPSKTEHYTKAPTSRQASVLKQPMRYLKGVGPARAEQLKRLGLATVEDLLWHVPRRYEDRRNFQTIDTVQAGAVVTLRASVLTRRLYRTRYGKTIVEAKLADQTGALPCVWFNQSYLASLLHVGDEVIVHGRIEPGKRLQLLHPEIEWLTSRTTTPEDQALEDDTPLNMGRIVPIYPVTQGLSQRWFRRMVRTALDHSLPELEDVVPSSMRERQHLMPFARAMEQVHFPDTDDEREQARRRLAFEELLQLQVSLALRRSRLAGQIKGRQYHSDGPLIRAFLTRLPFAFTASQQRVLEELTRELCAPTPMLRLLQGDVGCGKTVVAAALMAMVVESGYQVAVMAPTELLAEQHARVLRRYFEPLDLAVGLLIQGESSAQRKRLLEQVANGATSILVGTHALLEPAVSFAKLGLIIIDEQHKFGVAQRSALAKKAQFPDVLIMTATPIPRTLALTLYGDLNASTIAELPPGRQPVRSLWYQDAQRLEAYQLIRAQLQKGHQGYVVYPLVHVNERRELKAATQMAHYLQREIFPTFRVALLHGQLRPHQQETVMRGFLSGSIHLLVSTIIVEVGLDIPNATVMLIEHAERFGLAQLHQLRGRIGRSSWPSTCILISQAADELAATRLTAFTETTNGFRLAETDLELRGPGELLGRQQSGLLRFRVARLAQDAALLNAARQEAGAVVEQDPQLRHPEVAALARRVGASRFQPAAALTQ